MWPFKKTNYPDQEITEKQAELLNIIDRQLTDSLTPAKANQQMVIHHFVIPMQYQLLSVNAIAKRCKLPSEGGYIPRCIAFIQSGLDWHIMAGVFSENISPDETKQLLFSDALTRTKTARNNYEKLFTSSED